MDILKIPCSEGPKVTHAGGRRCYSKVLHTPTYTPACFLRGSDTEEKEGKAARVGLFALNALPGRAIE
jgi:hypothetical protein